jgi:hypothetical protein
VGAGGRHHLGDAPEIGTLNSAYLPALLLTSPQQFFLSRACL